MPQTKKKEKRRFKSSHFNVVEAETDIGTRLAVETRNAAAVLAITEDDKVIMVNQFRYPVKTNLLEVPAGKIEDNEDAAKAALRELLEETGYDSDHELAYLVDFFPSPGYLTEKITIYLLRGVRRRHKPRPDEDERIEVIEMSISDLLWKVKNREIKDGKTILALTFLKL